MVDTEKLIKEISKSGLKYSAIASKMNLSYCGLKKKIDNKNEFKASEIIALCKILDISNAETRNNIFFLCKANLE
jgi:hypothetical protein